MTGGQWALLSFLALALVLPAIALRDRGLSFSRGWRIAAIWLLLFVLVAWVFSRIGL